MPSEPPAVQRRMRPMLGTFVEVGLDAAATHATAGFESAFTAIAEVERSLSFHDPDSELSVLNRSAGRMARLSHLAITVLRAGRALSLASGGLFNYTIGGALVRRGVLPDHVGCAPPLDVGLPLDVEIKGYKARLTRPVRITLDGIAKGYAVDRAVCALRRQGVRAGWVNAGGDVRAFGPVTLPLYRRDGDGSVQALGGLRNAAAATSVVQHSLDARFPGEILTPGGKPACPGTWTVLAHSAWRADALTKVAALASPSARAALIGRLGGILIDTPKALH